MSNPPKKTIRPPRPSRSRSHERSTEAHLSDVEITSPRSMKKKTIRVIPDQDATPSSATVPSQPTSTRKTIQKGPLIGLAFFSIVIIIVIVLTIQFIFSRATIVVTLSPETIETPIDTLIGTNDLTPTEEEADGDVLDGTVRSIEDQLTMSITGLNPKRINRNAHATITVTNALDGPVTLLAQTAVVSEGGITFRLDRGIVIPSGGSSLVSITSEGTGEAMNVSPTRWTFPDLPDRFRFNVIGQSTEHATGGIENVAEVTASDIDQAKASVSNALVQRLRTSLLPADEGYFRITSPVILDIKTSAKPGDAVTSFEMTVAARLVIVELARAALSAAVVDRMMQSPAGKNIDPRLTIDPMLDDVLWSIDQVDYTQSRAMVHGSVPARLIPSHELLGVVPNDLVGQATKEIVARLQKNPTINAIDISIHPRLLSRMPLIPSRITVTTKISDGVD